jgi:hypothetical protein
MIRSDQSSDLFFNVQLHSRTPVDLGGDCTDASICNDNPTVSFPTTTSWEEHIVCFYNTVSQGYAGGPLVSVKPWEVSQFVLRPATGGDFHVQMDDLSFLPADDPICGTGNPDVPTGACSSAANGTIFASGNCATLHTFEETAGSVLYASDGRSGDGLLFPYLYPGQDESGFGSYLTFDDEDPDFVGDQLMNFTADEAIGFPVAFVARLAEGQCYDASPYTGIRFDAKTVSVEEMTIRLSLMTSDSNAYYDCPVDPSQCYDTFGAEFSVGPTWQTHEMFWADAVQHGWG